MHNLNLGCFASPSGLAWCLFWSFQWCDTFMQGKNKKKKEEEEEEERMKFFVFVFFLPNTDGGKKSIFLWEFRVKCNHSITFWIFGHLQICLPSSFAHLAKLHMLSFNFSLEMMSYSLLGNIHSVSVWLQTRELSGITWKLVGKWATQLWKTGGYSFCFMWQWLSSLISLKSYISSLGQEYAMGYVLLFVIL